MVTIVLFLEAGRQGSPGQAFWHLHSLELPSSAVCSRKQLHACHPILLCADIVPHNSPACHAYAKALVTVLIE